MIYIPPIGTTGIWTLLPPFDTMLQANAPYNLIAIRKLTDILASGGEPEADYYTVNNLDTNAYIADLEINASILSLQSDSGDVIYVPSTYVRNHPDIGGIPYKVLALTIDLGAIPDSLNLAYLTSKIHDDVLELIGVPSDVNIVSVSDTALLTNVDAATVEAARQANIGTALTDYAKYLQAVKERDSARVQIGLMQAYILRNRVVLGL